VPSAAYMTPATTKNEAEVARQPAQDAPARCLPGIAGVRDLAPEDVALEEGLPDLLAFSPDELHAGQLAAAIRSASSARP